MKSQHNVIINDTNSKEITLSYKNKPITGLYSTRFLLVNSGNQSIESKDIVSPMLVDIDANHILDIKKHKSNPVNFNPTVREVKSNEIRIDFNLINPGDEYEFDLLTNSPISSFKVSTRIKGIHNVETLHYIENPPLRDRVTNYQVIMFLVSLVLTILFWVGGRLFGPIRSTAYYIYDELPIEGFEEELFMRFLRRSTKNMLDEATLENIENRLKETEIHNEESLNKFREKTCYDLLNKDASGSMAIILLFMLGWVAMNSWSLLSSALNV